MQIYKGKRMHGKVGMGPVKVFDRAVVYKAYKTTITDRVAELERLRKAYEHTDAELYEIAKMAKGRIGRKEADIFDAHRMLLTDDNFRGEIKDMIVGESVCAEYAVSEVADKYVEFFKNSPSVEMQARAADIKDVSDRIIANLMGKRESLTLRDPAVVLAEELSPSEVISLEKKYARGIVVTKGSLNSHAAILARAADIPMVVIEDESIFETKNGVRAVVDGVKGVFIVDPDLPSYERYVEKLREQSKNSEDLHLFMDKETVTSSGKKVVLLTNASSITDVEECNRYHADGIGLFRTEFLFMGNADPLSEQEQYKIYVSVLKKAEGKPVTFRTADLGSDKKVDYISIPKEDNPALGLRGLRLSLLHKDFFKIQIKALLRAAAVGNLRIMYPMITSVSEIKQVQEVVEECRQELEKRRVKYAIPKQGIMIETPAAVMIAEELAEVSDFFSIGTNDLTQYALALDRQNGSLMDFMDPHHPAIVRMIEMATKGAKAHGIEVGICGEMAMDPSFLQKYAELGLAYMSVNPSNILQIRKNISNMP